MAIHTSARLDDAPPLWPAYEGPRCRWLLAQSDLPDDGWRRPSPVWGVPSFYEHPTEEEKALAAGFEAALDSGQAAWKPVAVELGGTRDGTWAPAGLGEYEPAPGYMFLMTWAVGPFPDREAAQRAAVKMTIIHTPDLFEAAEAAEAARLARFDLAFKLQDNVKATLLDPENLRLDYAVFAAAESLTSDIAEAMVDMVAPERRGSDLRERLTEIVQEAVKEAKLAELIVEQIEQSMRINAFFGPLEEIASRIAREIAQRVAKGETL